MIVIDNFFYYSLMIDFVIVGFVIFLVFYLITLIIKSFPFLKRNRSETQIVNNELERFEYPDRKEPLNIQNCNKKLNVDDSNFIQNYYRKYYHEYYNNYQKLPESKSLIKEHEEDEEYEMCRTFVINAQKASTSLLQRQFRIGYNKAACIIDQLESDGIIGPQIGSKPREVYVRGYEEVEFFEINIKTRTNNDVVEITHNGETRKFYYQDILEIESNIKKELYWYYENNKHDLLAAQNISELNLIKDGYAFEKFIAQLLIRLGYSARTTQSSNDYGVDVLAEKDNIKYAIQCKFYTSTVGNSAIQEVIGGKRYYNCHVAIVVTNNQFTKNAIDLAKVNNVILWDGDYLNQLIEKSNIDDS